MEETGRRCLVSRTDGRNRETVPLVSRTDGRNRETLYLVSTTDRRNRETLCLVSTIDGRNRTIEMNGCRNTVMFITKYVIKYIQHADC